MATGGDDNNSGLAPDETWKSLEKLRGVKSLPAKVLLKRGEVFNGELEITGQGIPEYCIYIIDVMVMVNELALWDMILPCMQPVSVIRTI